MPICPGFGLIYRVKSEDKGATRKTDIMSSGWPGVKKMSILLVFFSLKFRAYFSHFTVFNVVHVGLAYALRSGR